MIEPSQVPEHLAITVDSRIEPSQVPEHLVITVDSRIKPSQVHEHLLNHLSSWTVNPSLQQTILKTSRQINGNPL